MKEYYLEKSKEINNALRGLWASNPPSTLVREKILEILKEIYDDGFNEGYDDGFLDGDDNAKNN